MSIFASPVGLARRPVGLAVLAGLLALALVGAAVLPPARLAGAAPATATQDLSLFAGPGEEYGALAYAPYGAALSVDGEAVNGFYPVSYDGVSGWAATWAVAADAGFVSEPAYEEPVYEEAVSEETYGAAAPAADEGGIVGIIYAAADRYGQPREDMLRVATCESGLDPNAINYGGDSHGLFQFLPGTWASTPYAGSSIYDPYASANAAGWMWSQGRRGEWVCQ